MPLTNADTYPCPIRQTPLSTQSKPRCMGSLLLPILPQIPRIPKQLLAHAHI